MGRGGLSDVGRLVDDLDKRQDQVGSNDDTYRRDLAELLEHVEREIGPDHPVTVGLRGETAVMYAPMPLLRRPGDPRFPSPPAQEFIGETAMVWLADRASRSESARVRSRLGDFLWEFGSAASRGAAVIAPAAYARFGELLLDGMDLRAPGVSLQVADAITRGWELAQRMNQAPVASQLEELAVRFLEQSHRGDAGLGPVRDAARALQSVAKRLEVAQRRRAARALNECVARYGSSVPLPHLLTELFDANRALALDGAGVRAADRRAAAFYAEFAARRGRLEAAPEFWRIAILLAEQGQEAGETLNTYRQGLRYANEQLSDRTVVRMPTIALPKDVAEALKQEVERISLLDMADVADVVASELVLTRVQLEALARFEATYAPLSARMPVTIVGGSGQVVAPSGSESDHLRQLRLLHVRASDVKLVALWRKLRARAGSLDDVKRYFETRGFPEANRPLIHLGLDEMWNDRAPVALHILVPQLEDVLRQLVRRAGHDTMQTARSDRNVTEEVGLRPILAGLVSRNVISLDERETWESILDDPAGLNLRNRIGHGLARITELGESSGARVVFLYLVVGRWFERIGAEKESTRP